MFLLLTYISVYLMTTKNISKRFSFSIINLCVFVEYRWPHTYFIVISTFSKFFIQDNMDMNIFHNNKYNFLFCKCTYYFSLRNKHDFQIYFFVFFPKYIFTL